MQNLLRDQSLVLELRSQRIYLPAAAEGGLWGGGRHTAMVAAEIAVGRG